MVDAPCSRIGHIYRKFAPFPNPGVGDFVGRVNILSCVYVVICEFIMLFYFSYETGPPENWYLNVKNCLFLNIFLAIFLKKNDNFWLFFNVKFWAIFWHSNGNFSEGQVSIWFNCEPIMYPAYLFLVMTLWSTSISECQILAESGSDWCQ